MRLFDLFLSLFAHDDERHSDPALPALPTAPLTPLPETSQYPLHWPQRPFLEWRDRQAVLTPRFVDITLPKLYYRAGHEQLQIPQIAVYAQPSGALRRITSPVEQSNQMPEWVKELRDSQAAQQPHPCDCEPEPAPDTQMTLHPGKFGQHVWYSGPLASAAQEECPDWLNSQPESRRLVSTHLSEETPMLTLRERRSDDLSTADLSAQSDPFGLTPEDMQPNIDGDMEPTEYGRAARDERAIRMLMDNPESEG